MLAKIYLLSKLLLVFFTNYTISARVYYAGCPKNGFTCIRNVAKKLELTYTCPPGVNDAVLFLNQFSAPADIESLTITNCNVFTFSTRCSNENRAIKLLKITNVKNLIFQRLQYQSQLPETVIFENVSHIETIPSYTFAQIDKNLHTIGCFLPKNDFETLYFNNVTIGTLQSNAFVGTNNFKNFTFVNVRVKQMQASAINVRQEKSNSEFVIKKCNVDIAEHLAFQVYGKKVIFIENGFIELSSSAINGTVESFYFLNNSVEKMLPFSISILATNVYILNNNFLYLKSSAFEKISPGLIEESGRNFGKLKFIYDFSKNSVNFVDAGSLHPDMIAYDNVATEMTFSKNTFYCSCENIGWLVSAIGHGTNTGALEAFYEMVLEDSYENICSYFCELPVKSSLEKMMSNGRCLGNVTMATVCEDELRTTTRATLGNVGDRNLSKVLKPELLRKKNVTLHARSYAERVLSIGLCDFVLVSVLYLVCL